METLWRHSLIINNILLLFIVFFILVSCVHVHSFQMLREGSCSKQKVLSDGKPCILFQAQELRLRFHKTHLDLTERVFSKDRSVDTQHSICQQDTATLVLTFGDVEDFKALSIRLQMSNTFYESSGQWWFSLDWVSLHYNVSQEATFNVTDVFAPTSSSFRCPRVGSLQRHNALLLPANELAQRWSVTFTDFQIQAFNGTSAWFSPASGCSPFLTPALLMGLMTSVILLLVLAYTLNMVVHLKHVENSHKAEVYFPHSPEWLQPTPCEDR